MLPNAVGKKFSMYVNWPLKSTAQLNSPVVQSQSWRQHWHFNPRGAVLARYTSYGPVSVCLSVTSRNPIELAVLVWELLSTYPKLF